jgi:hypothetical protein
MLKKRRLWILCISTVLLLLLLGGFCTIWVAFGSGTEIMSQVGVQRMRVERLAKDVLVLANHPTLPAQAQATSEIQDTLPIWQKTQVGLQAGDASLGLPQTGDSGIIAMVSLAQIDFLPILVALQKLLRGPPIDPTHIQIVLSHENGYLVTMTQVNSLWQTHIDSVFSQLFWIEAAFITAILLLVALSFWYTYPHALRVDTGNQSSHGT